MRKTYKKSAPKILLFLLCLEMAGYICGFFILAQYDDYALLLKTTDFRRPATTPIIAGMQEINKFLGQYGYSALSEVLMVIFMISVITGVIALICHTDHFESAIWRTCISKGIGCLVFLPLLLYYHVYAYDYGVELLVLYLLAEVFIGFLTWNMANIWNIIRKLLLFP